VENHDCRSFGTIRWEDIKDRWNDYCDKEQQFFKEDTIFASKLKQLTHAKLKTPFEMPFRVYAGAMVNFGCHGSGLEFFRRVCTWVILLIQILTEKIPQNLLSGEKTKAFMLGYRWFKAYL